MSASSMSASSTVKSLVKGMGNLSMQKPASSSSFTEDRTQTPACLSTSQDSSSDANINGNVISSPLHATNGDEMVRVAAITTSFAGALIALNSYQCRECIEILHSLPKQ